MNLDDAVRVLDSECRDPHTGLPEPVFLLLSRLTPLVNVDLWIKDDAGRTLLTWRDDSHYGAGWHIPGGIIRFQESAQERIAAVARIELGCEVVAERNPAATHERMAETRCERGHFFSFLHRCTLATHPPQHLEYSGGIPRAGLYCFFRPAPENLLKVHEFYRPLIDS